MGFVGILCCVIAFLDLKTQRMGDLATVGLCDIIWPHNPYAFYRYVIHRDDVDDHHDHQKHHHCHEQDYHKYMVH